MGWSSPVTAAVTILAVAAMCLAVLLTQGRAVGTRDAVVSTLDDAGSRTITVRAESGADLTTGVLDRLDVLEGVSWYGAFGNATDVVAQNGGTKVPLRPWYGGSRRSLDLPTRSDPLDQGVYATTTALDELGLVDGYGPVYSDDGAGRAVVGTIRLPVHLRPFEPLLLDPIDPDGTDHVSLLIIVARTAGQVPPVAAAVTSILGADLPQGVTVTTSDELAGLQTEVNAQLSGFTTILVGGILTLTATLVAALQLGMVLLRRKDFGRRRALGASQSLVVGLLVVQTGLLAVVGSAVGTLVAVTILAVARDPLAGVEYIIGVAVLAVFMAIIGSLVPAIVAARRDPLHELRVP